MYSRHNPALSRHNVLAVRPREPDPPDGKLKGNANNDKDKDKGKDKPKGGNSHQQPSAPPPPPPPPPEQTQHSVQPTPQTKPPPTPPVQTYTGPPSPLPDTAPAQTSDTDTDHPSSNANPFTPGGLSGGEERPVTQPSTTQSITTPLTAHPFSQSSETSMLYGVSSTLTTASVLQPHTPGDPDSPPGSPSGIPRTVGATTKLNVGAVAGGVVGAVVALLLILLGVFLLMRRRKKRHLAPSAEFLGKNASFQRVPSFVETSYRHHPPSSFSPITGSALQNPVTVSNHSNPFADTVYHDQPVLNPSYVNIAYSDPSSRPSSLSHSLFNNPEDLPPHPLIQPSSSGHPPLLFAPNFKFPDRRTTNLYPTP